MSDVCLFCVCRLSIDSAIIKFISLAPCYPTWRYKLSLAQHRLPLWFLQLEGVAQSSDIDCAVDTSGIVLLSWAVYPCLPW